MLYIIIILYDRAHLCSTQQMKTTVYIVKRNLLKGHKQKSKMHPKKKKKKKEAKEAGDRFTGIGEEIAMSIFLF